ncbi:MAG: DUF1828 domain-containing protein [Selenomonadales bacterium]|nr:DUF1828 domain-containing protein [Selenomonadales bacterium]
MAIAYQDLLRTQLNNRISFREKRPGIVQLFAPFYHEDGDMVDVFFQEIGEDIVRISDYGLTVMRLSYNYELDTPHKEKVFTRIIAEHGLKEEHGNIYADTDAEHLYMNLMTFVQVVSKVSSMRHFSREVVRSMFYEMLEEHIMGKFSKYHPAKRTVPLVNRDDLEVDMCLEVGHRPIYLFGVKDAMKARLVTISCLEFQKARLPFRSVIVHEDMSALSPKDIRRLTNAADKQFPSLEDFKADGETYLEREAAAS